MNRVGAVHHCGRDHRRLLRHHHRRHGHDNRLWLANGLLGGHASNGFTNLTRNTIRASAPSTQSTPCATGAGTPVWAQIHLANTMTIATTTAKMMNATSRSIMVPPWVTGPRGNVGSGSRSAKSGAP